MFHRPVYSICFFEFIMHASADIEFNAMNRLSNISLSTVTAALTVALATGAATFAPPVVATPVWVATWQASPQPVWGSNFLFPTNVPATLHDQTVRQVARISMGGKRLRIALSNAYGTQPIFLGKATIAQPKQDGGIDPDSLQTVTFGGREMATVLPGASLISDPVAFAVPALARVGVSLYLQDATPVKTFHWDGRQTGWIVPGDQTTAPVLQMTASNTLTTTARPFLTGIQVEAEEEARAIVVMGDSITDGATASLDKDSRWPDFLATRLAPHGVALVNAGISGARLLSDGMGVNALARLERDVLAQPGIRSVVVMLGINDIAWPGTAFARETPRPTLEAMIAGYSQLIEQARVHDVRVIGTTLLPFEGALPGTPLADYYHPDKEDLRLQVNNWIRHSGAFDAVIDFDSVLRDPAHPKRIASRFDSGDQLHPGDEGNRAMAEAIDLEVLIPGLGAKRSADTTPSVAHP